MSEAWIPQVNNAEVDRYGGNRTIRNVGTGSGNNHGCFPDFQSQT